MKKTFRLIGIVIMAIICCGLTACGGDDDDSNNGAISEYVGSWSCTSPATYQTSTIVTKGTTLLITSSGDMTWTMPATIGRILPTKGKPTELKYMLVITNYGSMLTEIEN